MHAVTTRSDEARGEALVLFTTAADIAREALGTAAKALGAPELAIPRHIRQVEAIPLLGSGKIDYVSLKNMAQTLDAR